MIEMLREWLKHRCACSVLESGGTLPPAARDPALARLAFIRLQGLLEIKDTHCP